jgi:hypothetical protein
VAEDQAPPEDEEFDSSVASDEEQEKDHSFLYSTKQQPASLRV